MQQSLPAVAYATPQQVEGWTLKEKIVYSLLGMVLIGTTIYIARRAVINRTANKEESKSLDDGSAAAYAKQLKMGFENDGWPGTDTTVVRDTLIQIPSRAAYNKVEKSYERLYSTPRKKASLNHDLSSELQTSEYSEMMQIIDAKPKKANKKVDPQLQFKAWAKRLKAAFDKTYGFIPGTDSDAIVAVFNEIPTQAAFVKVCDAYQRSYHTKMLDDLKSESEFGQYGDWMQIITSKPQN